VLHCVCQLCTVISTLRWVVLTVLWVEFCHAGPISLCVDLVVFIFVCFCFVLYMCCIIVSTVGLTWWTWSLILGFYLLSVVWRYWLGHLTCKSPSTIWPIMCLVGRKPCSTSTVSIASYFESLLRRSGWHVIIGITQFYLPVTCLSTNVMNHPAFTASATECQLM